MTARWLAFFLVSCASTSLLVEVVVARCKEDITWIREMGYDAFATVLDKCGTTDGPGRHILQPNVGREGGSYLQYIVDRYDNLAEWTVFTQAEKPTYGYRGHRLGGGHLMNNVRFQDYVEAAANRMENPVFFVFSTALVATDDNAYQCLRAGYGEEYRAPASKQDRMCGDSHDWQQWYAFPEWFKDMIVRLQSQQAAPVQQFDAEVVLDLFGVHPKGVMFFTQGARFGASREAIRSHPRAYYEALLKYFNNVDPWAGYFLEWLWYYVLGGKPTPCGFEQILLQRYQTWQTNIASLKSRGAYIQQATTSGVSGSGNCTLSGSCLAPPGTVLIVPLTTADLKTTGGTLQVTQTSTTVQGNLNATNGGNLTITQSGTTMQISGVILFNGAILQITASVTSTTTMSSSGAVTFSSSTLTTGGTGILSLGSTAGTVTMTSNTVQISIIFTNFQVLILSFDVWQSGTTCTIPSGSSRRSRANSAISNPAYLCGESLANVVLAANSGAIVQTQCTATGNGGYSNTINSLSYTSPATLRFDQVGSSSSKPILISNSWSSPSGMTLQVSNASSGAYCSQLVVYNNPGTCTTSFSSTSVDTCPSGYTCSFSGSTLNSTSCQVTYCQTLGSTDSGNNNGLLGLIALVALVPLAALCGLVAWLMLKPPVEAAPPMVPMDPYAAPSVYQPGYTLQGYPTIDGTIGYTLQGYPTANGINPSVYGFGYGPSITPAGFDFMQMPMY